MVNLQECILAGTLPARIEVVISSRAAALGVERAKSLGLRVTVVEHAALLPTEFDHAVDEVVGEVDLVCMAGFLSLWRIPPRLEGRVINIHPALLPDFGGKGMYGRHVHEAVLVAGRIVSGCTVHFCDNEYDHGPIILQREVPVLTDDTPDVLAARVFREECIAYPEAIRTLVDGRVRWFKPK